jgi:hypothetical protein
MVRRWFRCLRTRSDVADVAAMWSLRSTQRQDLHQVHRPASRKAETRLLIGPRDPQ